VAGLVRCPAPISGRGSAAIRESPKPIELRILRRVHRPRWRSSPVRGDSRKSADRCPIVAHRGRRPGTKASSRESRLQAMPAWQMSRPAFGGIRWQARVLTDPAGRRRSTAAPVLAKSAQTSPRLTCDIASSRGSRSIQNREPRSNRSLDWSRANMDPVSMASVLACAQHLTQPTGLISRSGNHNYGI
jgi:hypothetical protein